MKELNTLLLAEETLGSTLERVTHLALETLPGCDAVGLTLVVGSTPSTAAATDAVTLEIDRQQYAAGEGPCLEAYRTGETIQMDDVDAEDRWPQFIEGAASAGLRSSPSLPLEVGDNRFGALNIYSKTPNSFDEKARDLGLRFSKQASVALSNAQVYASAVQLAEHLQDALKTREVIGQAKGILMVQQSIGEEEAFQVLVKLSQTSNVKLREIAQKVVERSTSDVAGSR